MNKNILISSLESEIFLLRREDIVKALEESFNSYGSYPRMHKYTSTNDIVYHVKNNISSRLESGTIQSENHVSDDDRERLWQQLLEKCNNLLWELVVDGRVMHIRWSVPLEHLHDSKYRSYSERSYRDTGLFGRDKFISITKISRIGHSLFMIKKFLHDRNVERQVILKKLFRRILNFLNV